MAERGDAEAQNILGMMYVEGRGVPQDYAEAAKWYRKAAQQGHAEAQSTLDIISQELDDVPQDDAEVAKQSLQEAEKEDTAGSI